MNQLYTLEHHLLNYYRRTLTDGRNSKLRGNYLDEVDPLLAIVLEEHHKLGGYSYDRLGQALMYRDQYHRHNLEEEDVQAYIFHQIFKHGDSFDYDSRGELLDFIIRLYDEVVISD